MKEQPSDFKAGDWDYIKLRNSGVVAIFDYLWYDGINFKITNEDKNERICITASNYIHIP